MRRNYASLDLQALSAAASCDADEDIDAHANGDNTFAVDVAEDGIAQLSLEDVTGGYDSYGSTIGFPMELMASANECSASTMPSACTSFVSMATPVPTSSVPVARTPPSAVPTNKSSLPCIRPATKEPVRRSILSTSCSPPDFSSMSKLSMSSLSSSASSASSTSMMSLRVGDYMATGPKSLMVAMQRHNAIQSV